MLQLQLSSALKGRKHDHKVVCVQRTAIGLYVGTMRATDDGYMGHLLSPLHPLLPATPSDGRLGFLHINHDEAFEALALQVAKAAWNGSLYFEATCLDNCTRSTRDAFTDWLLTQISNTQSTALHSKPRDDADRRSNAVRIKAEAAQERSKVISENFLSKQFAQDKLQ